MCRESSGKFFKEILCERLSFPWGGAKVLSMGFIVQILRTGGLHMSSSLCPHYAYLWRWPMRYSFLLTTSILRYTYSRIRLQRRGPPNVRRPQVFHMLEKWLKNSPQGRKGGRCWHLISYLDSRKGIITINVPVVFMAQYVMVLRGVRNIITRAIGRGGPWKSRFFWPWNGMSEASAIWAQKVTLSLLLEL